MDKSETYIKMAGKAEEIQNKWKPEIYDSYVERSNIRIIPDISTRIHLNNRFKFDVVYMWLPRQDQLQELLNYSIAPLGITWKFFWSVYGDAEDDKNREYWSVFNSMEQLWLAFVMKEKFNKIWTGKEWKEQ